MTGEAKSGPSDPLPAEAFLRTSLADAGSRPALVLLEGDAGSGKSEVTTRWIRAAADWNARTVLYTPATDGSTAPDLAAIETPALLVVEDVHRAPAETMPWLRAWLREARPGFVTVVSYRPAELPEPACPLGLDPQFPPPLRIRRERLGAWEQHRTTALALEILGPERSSERLSHQLHQLAGGNPQTIRDLLDSLEEAADASTALQKLEEVEPPVRLTQHITTRAATLGGDATALVRAAAVLGGSCRERDLRRVAGLGRTACGAALVQAVRSGLLEERAPDRYGFTSPLAASALLTSLPGPIRCSLHQRAADMLTRSGKVPWVAVAHHQRLGGRESKWLRAAEHATDDPNALADPGAAVNLLRSLLRRPDLPALAAGRLALGLTRNALLTLPSIGTVDVLGQILVLPQLADEVRGEIRLERGLVMSSQLSRGEGKAEIELALTELRSRPDLRVRALAALANPLSAVYELDANVHWWKRAQAMAEASGDATDLLAAHAVRGTIAVACGERRSVPGLPGDLPEPDSDLDPRRNEYLTRALSNAACCAVFNGDLQQAAALLRRSATPWAAATAPFITACDRGTRLLLCLERGEWSGLGRASRVLLSGVGTQADARLVLLQLALARGAWEDCATLQPGPDDLPRVFSQLPYEVSAAGIQIRMAVARQNPGEAVAAADRIWHRLRAKGVWVWAAHAAPWAVEAWLLADGENTARAAVAEFASGLRTHHSRTAGAALLRCRALLAEHEVQHGQARELFVRAALIHERTGAPYRRALDLEAAGRCGLTVRPPAADPGPLVDGALRNLEQAIQVFESLGASWDALRARGTLRALMPRGRSPALSEDASDVRGRGRPPYGNSLSPREQEVAALAAGGMTNREIAGALHLSPRTVEQHVYRIMRKTQAASRRHLPTSLTNSRADGKK
ncbi:helix-turn-helix transcriptional regulator [Streptomyces sp. M54]|uniref:helix-turn-helix transcriptional regulator n=1 Tax=Streptomyces sp. M54 TaxID=2759525 RepID=UPI001A8FE6D9|nr:helix-turn-helix transcriptional regulator [Streptomyces sp. M54]QSS89181.1 LuxR family transcriptional regulator [Streptomyces sp. M54]